MELPPDPSPRRTSALRALAARVEVASDLLGLVLVGSVAAGRSDPLSDLDTILVAAPGTFDRVWDLRCRLHGPDIAACWDHLDADGPDRCGAHKWIDDDLVLVDCLITEAGAGVRLAEPYLVVAGADEVAAQLEARPPVDRSEMRGVSDDRRVGDLDIESAYDVLKRLVRRRR